MDKKKSPKEEKSKNSLVAKMSIIALSAYAIFKLKTETDILEKYFNLNLQYFIFAFYLSYIINITTANH